MEREKLISLVTSAQQGNEGALNDLFNAFYNDVYYFALKTVKDEDLACDITQETFVEIINTLGNLQEPAAFVKWMKQITYHQCTRHFKKKTDVLVEEDEDGNTVFDTLAEERAEFIPDEALDQQDFKNTIMAMVDELTEEQRAAVMMFYYDELSVKQIAEIQGVSENTVKSRLNYARKGIKQSVEAYEKKNGIKLHCAGVLPLLLWLFKGHFAQSAPASAAAVAQGVAAATGTAVTVTATTTAAVAATAATSAATAAAATATVGIGAKIAALPIATKIIAGVVAASLVVGGGTAAVVLSDRDTDTSDSNPSIVSSEPTHPTAPTTPTVTTTPTTPTVSENRIPEGMVYTLHDGTVLNAGEKFPETCTAGDKVVYGDYHYGYECIYTQHLTGGDEQREWMFCKDIQTPADSGVIREDISNCWLPVVSSQDKIQYGPILKEINGKPIGVLWMTFYGCKNMTVAPEIPEGVTSTSVAFYDCVSLKTAPVIPASVKRILGTFQNCTSLTGDVVIHANIDKSTLWNYNQTFANTVNPINLTGSAPEADLLLIADEPTNRKITVNGKVIDFEANKPTEPTEPEPTPQFYDPSRKTTSTLTMEEVVTRMLANAENIGGESYGDPMTAIYAVDYAASCFKDMDIFGYGITEREMCADGWGYVNFYTELIGTEMTPLPKSFGFDLRFPFEHQKQLGYMMRQDVTSFIAFLNSQGRPKITINGKNLTATVGVSLEQMIERIAFSEFASVAGGESSIRIFSQDPITINGKACHFSMSANAKPADGVNYYFLNFSISFGNT